MKKITNDLIVAAAVSACVLSLGAAARADDAKACEATYDRGSQLFAAKKLDDAAAAFAAGYKACGSGHGFHSAEGFVRETQGKLEDAAVLFLAEASEPGPVAEAFGNLEHIRDQLSAKTRARIVAMGPTAAAPVYVRGIPGEYSWARAFTCLGAKKLGAVKQSIAKGAHGEMLDLLQFSCPGEKTTHSVYFDYGVDEQEQEYLRERQQIDAQPGRH